MITLLFTGLSGAGKSTLAQELALRLQADGKQVAIIDGDQYRNTLNKDLGFSEEDRRENINRLMKVAVEKNKEGHISIVAAINPFDDQRLAFSETPGVYVVHINCPLNVLLQRDTKGLYKKAMLPATHPDKIHNLTGVNDRYDIPSAPQLTIHTHKITIAVATQQLYDFVLPLLQKS